MEKGSAAMSLDWVEDRTEFQSISRLGMPVTLYDQEGDVLTIELSSVPGPLSAEFDEQEITVHRVEGTQEVVSFDILFYQKYWASRLDELLDVLSKHAPGERDRLSGALFVRTDTTAR